MPTREGYTFLGWYTEAVGGTKILETSAFPAPATYYTHWSL